MRFFGNGICCASYACLNAMQDPSIDLQLFEISLSTPFGIRHYENGLFDRLLTTYCDPNKGLDRALRIWGYRVQTHRIATPEEAVVCIRSLIQPGNPVLIGPIDMGALGYQIMPSMLRRMDHYLVLEFYTDNQVLCTDSEGFLQYPLEDAQLCRYLNAEQVLEAEGCITVRQIEKEYQYNMEEILRFALKFAADNLQAAEESEEGSHAINKCFEYLQQNKKYKWRLPFLYDLQYLKQRKRLLLFFIEVLEEYKIRTQKQMEELKKNAAEQNDLLGKVYEELRSGGGIDREMFAKAAELETRISNRIRSDSGIDEAI